MITKRTLLVLGAGASIPYGFPSGNQLSSNIRSLAKNLGANRAALFSELGFDEGQVQSLASRFSASGSESIDPWLADNPDDGTLGKAIIAMTISEYEKIEPRTWYPDGETRWYAVLWRRMRRGCRTLTDILVENQLRIFTFNYDRSLEWFLARAIRNQYPGVTDAQAEAFVDELKIQHAYGEIGKFGFKDEFNKGVRRFGPIDSIESLKCASSSLSVISDARKSSQSFMQFREWLKWAEHVAFMGFSFDDLNMELLSFSTLPDSERAHKRYYGCFTGMTKIEANIAMEYINDRQKLADWVKGEREMDAYAFLRDSDLLRV